MITLENCAHLWPSGRGLFELDFTIHPGELVAICGRNGAGKTTFLNLVAGLLEPTKGKIVRDLEFAAIGRLPVEDFLEPSFTIQENLALLSHLKTGSTKAWTALTDAKKNPLGVDVIELLDLAPLLQKPLRTLSTGERKKAHIVASLLGECEGRLPQLLVWDEPHSSLDLVANLRLTELLTALTKAGVAMVLATHVAETLLQLEGRCLVLQQGRASREIRLPEANLVAQLVELTAQT